MTLDIIVKRNLIECKDDCTKAGQLSLYYVRKKMYFLICSQEFIWHVCLFGFSSIASEQKRNSLELSYEEVTSKFHIFWEGHKSLQNLHRKFVLWSNGQIYEGDFAKFCGLLRIHELYDKHSSRAVIQSDKKWKCYVITVEADGPGGPSGPSGPGGQLRDLVVFQGFPVYFLPLQMLSFKGFLVIISPP